MKVSFRGGILLRKGILNRNPAMIFLKTLALATALLFFWGIPGQASAAITSTNLPDVGLSNTPIFQVNQAITVTFDKEIGPVDDSMITLVRTSDSTVGNYVYSKSGSTLTVVPVFDGSGGSAITTANKMLQYNTKYTFSITDAAAVKDSDGNSIAEVKSYTFTTAHNFQSLLGTSTLSTLIAANAPRGLNILIPKKYMTKFDISYITKAGTTSLSDPLTSVDITADADVDRIDVTFNGLPFVAAKKLDNVFNAGYQGVMTQTDANGKEVGYDITFSAYDKNDRLLETRTEKLDPKGKKSVTVNSKKVEGTKTLQELIVNNGKMFADILNLYTTSDLSLSIR